MSRRCFRMRDRTANHAVHRMPLDYHTMSLSAIADDLLETLSDLVINAGESHLQPQIDALAEIEFAPERQPSARLVAVMRELYTFDADLLAARAQDLLRDAVTEIQRLHDPAA